MGGLTLSQSIINQFLDVFRRLNASSRKKLLKILSDAHKKSDGYDDKEFDISQFVGIWNDDPRTSDEIIEDIRKARTQSREIEPFQ